MFALDDTIVAIATPPGRGGLGVVRISGPQACEIAQALLHAPTELVPRRATYVRVSHTDAGETPDEAVLTWFAAHASYTGQDVVEISAHGSPVVLQSIVRQAMAAGARLARPGEFTLRSFLTGKRDLVRAEAVADLIEAATPLQARVAFDQLQGTLTQRIAAIERTVFELIVRLEASLDFPDEGYHFIEPAEIGRCIGGVLAAIDALLGDARRGRLIREGATVVIAGRPNVGKSSLFNAVAGAERAIVTAVPGTTRDLLTERVDVEGIPVLFVDTAGARETSDIVEVEGVSRGIRARESADLVIVVLDRSEPLTADDERLLDSTSDVVRLIVVNKSDRPACAWYVDGAVAFAGARAPGTPVHDVSALAGDGVDALRRALATTLSGGEPLRDTAAISNVRHIGLLEQAGAHLRRARQSAVDHRAPEEYLLTDLQEARRCFDEVVGARTTEDVLNEVFARFCIGK
jgi:tRNA modification GTPase